MSDLSRLADKWRGLVKFKDVAKGEVLTRCADELELAYHQDRHDAEFYPDCRFCDWERVHNDNYPEDREA